MGIVRVYFDQDMRCSVDGLKRSLAEKGVPVPARSGDLVLFMNKSKKMFKLLGGNYVVFFKAPLGTRVTIEDIQDISSQFMDTGFKRKNMEKQAKDFLKKGAVIYTGDDDLKVAS